MTPREGSPSGAQTLGHREPLVHPECARLASRYRHPTSLSSRPPEIPRGRPVPHFTDEEAEEQAGEGVSRTHSQWLSRDPGRVRLAPSSATPAVTPPTRPYHPNPGPNRCPPGRRREACRWGQGATAGLEEGAEPDARPALLSQPPGPAGHGRHATASPRGLAPEMHPAQAAVPPSLCASRERGQDTDRDLRRQRPSATVSTAEGPEEGAWAAPWQMQASSTRPLVHDVCCVHSLSHPVLVLSTQQRTPPARSFKLRAARLTPAPKVT